MHKERSLAAADDKKRASFVLQVFLEKRTPTNRVADEKREKKKKKKKREAELCCCCHLHLTTNKIGPGNLLSPIFSSHRHDRTAEMD